MYIPLCLHGYGGTWLQKEKEELWKKILLSPSGYPQKGYKESEDK